MLMMLVLIIIIISAMSWWHRSAQRQTGGLGNVYFVGSNGDYVTNHQSVMILGDVVVAEKWLLLL